MNDGQTEAETAARAFAGLPGFVHLAGAHCSSSAVRSVLAYDGLDLSEALVFGLGSGLGFFYRLEPEASPTRRFNGRAPDLEGNFYRLAGRPLEWAGRWQPDLIQAGLEAGRPLLAQTDIYPIPYYDDAHFSGHGLAVVGLEADRLTVADIASPELLTLPLSAFRAAVAQPHPPLLEPYRYAVAPRLRDVGRDDLAAWVPKALGRTLAYLRSPPSPDEGLAAMRRLAADLPSWHTLPDAAWCARFGYQAIEKRGTGGGNFRALFRDFLLETQSCTNVPEGVIAGWAEAAERWSEVGSLLKDAAFAEGEPQRARFAAAGACVAALADLEADLCAGLENLVQRSTR